MKREYRVQKLHAIKCVPGSVLTLCGFHGVLRHEGVHTGLDGIVRYVRVDNRKVTCKSCQRRIQTEWDVRRAKRGRV